MGMHIAQALVSIKQQRKNEVVIHCDGRKVSGDMLFRRVAALEAVLSKLGVSRGDRVALASQNRSNQVDSWQFKRSH